MEDLVNTLLLAMIIPGLLTGLIVGLGGGAVTGIMSAVAGAVLGFGGATLFARLIPLFGSTSETLNGPVALLTGSILGGLIAAWIVRKVMSR